MMVMAFYAVVAPPSLGLQRPPLYLYAAGAQLHIASPDPHFLRLRRPPRSTASALHSYLPRPAGQGSRFEEWDVLTARFAGASNLPFLHIQLPQILLNAGNRAALLAVPWLGMLTGLLGNLTLLSYFVKKKENEAVLVQTLGVVSIYVVIAQLALAEAMPLPQFAATSVVVAGGLVLNFMNYFGWLPGGVWRQLEDFITIAGLSVLPQVMWSTFVPFIPNTVLPGTISFIMAVAVVVMAAPRIRSSGKLTKTWHQMRSAPLDSEVSTSSTASKGQAMISLSWHRALTQQSDLD